MLHNGYRAHLEGIGRARATVDDYVRVIRRADRWLREHTGQPIEAARPSDVRAWSDTTPYTWSTRKQQRSALRAWQEWAHHPDDLSGAIRVPRKPRMRCRAPEDHEMAALLDAAHKAGHRGLAVLLGTYLGMRCTEIASATWSGYDGRTFTWVRAKTGDVARLPVAAPLAAALDRQERWSPYIFPSTARRKPGARPHVAEQTVWQWIVKISESVGLRISTHQLRHASIARVVDTLGLRVGQEWAGHRDPEVTAGYSRVRDRQLADAAGTLRWDAAA